MLRWLKRVLKAFLLVVALVVAIPVLGLAYGFLTTDAPAGAPIVAATPERAAVHDALAREIQGYQRPEEPTYLTYP